MTRRIPPSFDFFPDDFIAGTVHLPPLAVGIYTRLLCWQWSAGHIPDRPDQCMRICGCSGQEWESSWPDLASKFPPAPDGLRRNPRLEAERAKKIAICEKRADAARRGRSHTESTPSKCPANAVANAEHLPSKREVGSRKQEGGSRSSEDASRTKDAGAIRGRSHALPESANAVAEWCTANDVRIDAAAFYNHYASQGWKKGNGRPVTDWHAAARAWEGRQATMTPTAKPSPTLFEQQRLAMTADAFTEVFRNG
jgi:uncharacterized protein YdaU (DUF1376 family)